MRVLQLLPELNVGGVETGVVDLAIALKARGHEVHVISNGGTLVDKLEQREIPHCALPVHRKSPIHMLQLIPEVARYIRAHQIEIVHARSRVPGWIGFWAARLTGVRFITTCHGHYTPHMLSRVMAWGRLVIVPSQLIKRHMIEAFGVPQERIRVIARGVDLRKFPYRKLSARAPRTLRVGLIGRLTPLKGHVILFRAAVRVVRALPHVKIVIVGDASPGKSAYRDELELWVRRLGLSRAVEFVGASRDVPAILKEVDLVVVPSTQPESFGRAVIEAQATGIPVIASRIGGLAEIVVDGKTGLLVPPNDPEALAHAMIRVLSDRGLARELSATAREAVAKLYPLSQMVKQTLAVYEELLKSTKILVMKLSAVGDVILASPSFRAIREHHPHATVTCMTGRPARPVVQRCPYFDDIVVDDSTGAHRGIRGAWRLGRGLRRHAFDVVFDLQNNRRSRIMGWATGAPKRFGYANGKWSWLLTHRASGVHTHMPPVEHQFQLLRQCGLTPADDRLACWTAQEDEASAARLLRRHWHGSTQPLIALHPGSSSSWDTKRWPVEFWAELCTMFARAHMRTVITGTAEELPFGEAIVQATRAKPMLAMGKTSLGELTCLFRAVHAVVTVDTASSHIAAAIGTPVVALFGPTDPRRHAPPAAHIRTLWKQVSCSPCYHRRCPLPKAHSMRCMTEITPAEVITAVRTFVKSPRSTNKRTGSIVAGKTHAKK